MWFSIVGHAEPGATGDHGSNLVELWAGDARGKTGEDNVISFAQTLSKTRHDGYVAIFKGREIGHFVDEFMHVADIPDAHKLYASVEGFSAAFPVGDPADDTPAT